MAKKKARRRARNVRSGRGGRVRLVDPDYRPAPRRKA
jgi:hypothetical protein